MGHNAWEVGVAQRGRKSMNRILWPGLPSDTWGCWLSVRRGEPVGVQRPWVGAPAAEAK